MKRIFSVLLLLVILISGSIGLIGCGKKDVIRIAEVTRSVFYAPFYVALNNGYFRDEGMEIELTTSGGSDATMISLISGSADIGLMGPETNVYSLAGGNTNTPKIFAQLTKRDGSFLVSRVSEPNFKWTDLRNKYVIGGRRGGSPAMNIQYVLENNGLVIGTDVTLDLDVPFTSTIAAFESGLGDYVTMFEPSASEFEALGKGYIVASVGEEAGEVPFTCFSATQSFLSANSSKIDKFIKCLIRAYNFIITSDIDDVIDALLPSFTSSTRDSLMASVNSYIDIDAWNPTLIMKSSSFERLQSVMINAGTLEERVLFSSAVDNSYAERVLAGL